MNYATAFRELASRFESVEANDPQSGQFFLKRIAESAGQLAMNAHRDGILKLPSADGFDDIAADYRQRTSDRSAAPFVRWSFFYVVGSTLATLNPHLLPDHFGVVRMMPTGPDTALGQTVAADWRERRRDYATACRLLAELCDRSPHPKPSIPLRVENDVVFLRGVTFPAEAFQQDAGGFVGRVLRDELSREGLLM